MRQKRRLAGAWAAAPDARPGATTAARTAVQVMLLGALLGGPVAISFGLLVLVKRDEALTRKLARDLIAPIIQREQDILTSITALDRLQTRPCEDADLRELRALVFNSGIIQDIARRQDGRGICSAMFGNQQVTLPAPPAPGYVLSPEQTVWRNVQLPMFPGHRFLVIGHRGFIILARMHGPDGFSPLRTHEVSGFLVNRATGQVSLVRGGPMALTPADLSDGNSFWRGGRYLSVACTADGAICIAASMHWAGILFRHVLPFVGFVGAGGVVGSCASVLAILWRRQRISLHARLQQAIRRKDLALVYQPVVFADTHRIASAEALMRWRQPGSDPVEPELFIPVAEQHGLIGDLTVFAISTASRELGDLLRSRPDFSVSINIVADDLAEQRFHDALAAHIVAQGIEPAQIVLELTERRSAQVEAANHAINRLRALGYKFCIDDFGTGFSSLTYLSDLSIDAIKLDKSFTSTVDTQAARARLVPPIMDMAREIGVPVVAEGVETAMQAAYFRQHGAAFLQGWLFGRPEPAADLIRRVKGGLPA